MLGSILFDEVTEVATASATTVSKDIRTLFSNQKQKCTNVKTNIILTVFLFCTEKYKPEVDNTDRACEVGILTEGLYFEVRIRKQLVLYLLTGRNSVNKKGFK